MVREEHLLTRLEVDSHAGHLITGFRNLGLIHFPKWQHWYVANMGKKWDSQANKELLTLKRQIEEDTMLGDCETKVNSKYWLSLMLQAPIFLKDHIPKQFVTRRYTPQARYRLANPGTFFQLDERDVEVLRKTQEIEKRLQEVRTKVKPKQFHDLNDLFDYYDGLNFVSIEDGAAREESLIEIDSDILEERKKIEDEIIAINRISPNSRVRYDVKGSTRERVLNIFQDDFEFLKQGRMITGKEFMNLKWLLFDTEAPAFMRGDFETTDIGAALCKGGKVLERVIFTKHDSGKQKIEGYKINNNCSDPTASFTDYIIDRDPDVCSCYNARYDFIAMRESNAGFPIGHRRSNPIFKATIPFFERIGVRDRLVVDFLRWSQTARGFDPNNKLEMTAGMKKSINYFQLEALNDEAEAGDIESTKTKLEYLVGDVEEGVVKLYQAPEFEKEVEDVCWIANLLNLSPERLMHSVRCANEAQERTYWTNLGVYRDLVPPHLRHTRTQKLESAARQLFARHVTKKSIKQEEERGRVTEVYKAYIPVGNLFKNLVAIRFPEAGDFYDYKDRVSKIGGLKRNVWRIQEGLENLAGKFFPDKVKPRDRVLEHKRRGFFLEQFADAFAKWMLTDDGLYLKEVKSLDGKLDKVDAKEFGDVYKDFRAHLKTRSDKDLQKLNSGHLGIRAIQHNSTPELEGFLKKYGLNHKIFRELANHRSRVKRWGRSIIGNYLVFPSRDFFVPEKHRKKDEIHILDETLDMGFNEINEFLDESGLELVAHEGNYLYLKGDRRQLERDDAPLVLVDKIPVVYNADCVYYEKQGYISHMKLSDDPTYHLSVFEMRAYGKMLKSLFEGRDEEAKELFYQELYGLKKGEVEIRDLLYHNKKRAQFIAITEDSERKDKKIYFTTNPNPNEGLKKDERKEILLDEQRGLNYFVEHHKRIVNGKEVSEDKRIYLAQPEQMKPYLKGYERRFVRRGKAILKPVLERQADSEQKEFALT